MADSRFDDVVFEDEGSGDEDDRFEQLGAPPPIPIAPLRETLFEDESTMDLADSLPQQLALDPIFVYYKEGIMDRAVKCTMEELLQMYEQHELHDQCFVWAEVDNEWRTMQDVVHNADTGTHYGNDIGYSDKSALVNIFTYYYHTVDDDDIVGPCSLEELLSLFARGDVDEATPVWTSGQEQYEPLAHLPLAYTVVPDFLYKDTPAARSLHPDLLALYTVDTAVARDKKDIVEGASPMLGYLRAERLVLQTIKQRFISLASSHTFCGPSQLLSVNPLMERNAVREAQEFVDLSSIDSQQPGRRSRDPHPFSIAEGAYQAMAFFRRSQSIVVLGDSGSGKTESFRQVLRYLSDRSKIDSDAVDRSHDDTLEQMIPKALTVLESFCCARTERNSNSSRFCCSYTLDYVYDGSKIYNLKDDPQYHLYWDRCQLARAQFDVYMLEKDRLVDSSLLDDNFHIFYELYAMSYVNKQSLSYMAIRDVAFDILPSTHTALGRQQLEASSQADTANFNQLVDCLYYFGLEEATITEMWMIVCGVLHLGNVSFEPEVQEVRTKGLSKMFGSSKKEVEYRETGAVRMGNLQSQNGVEMPPFHKMFLIDKAVFVALLTEKSVFINGRVVSTKLSAIECYRVKHAVMRALYEGLVSHIVSTVNAAMLLHDRFGTSSNDPSQKVSINIFDCFGFECFHHNNLNQLVNNFVAESLNTCFFKLQVEQRKAFLCHEGFHDMALIEDSNMPFAPRGKAYLDIFTSIPVSLFSLLDQLSAAYVDKNVQYNYPLALHSNFAGDHANRLFVPLGSDDKAVKESKFCIQHFNGRVCYSADSEVHSNSTWLDRSVGQLPPTLQSVLSSSQIKTLREIRLPPNLLKSSNYNSSKALITGVREQQFHSLSASVKDSYLMIENVIESTDTHYIQCILPSESNSIGDFDDAFVAQQLRNHSVVQGLNLSNEVFPLKVSFVTVRTAMKSVYVKLVDLFKDSQSLFVACMLQVFKIGHMYFKFGQSHVFFDSSQLRTMDQLLNVANRSAFEEKGLIEEARKCYAKFNDNKMELIKIENKLSKENDLFRGSSKTIGGIIAKLDQFKAMMTLGDESNKVDTRYSVIVVEEINDIFATIALKLDEVRNYMAKISLQYATNLGSLNPKDNEKITEVLKSSAEAMFDITNKLDAHKANFSKIKVVLNSPFRVKEAVDEIQTLINKNKSMVETIKNAKNVISKAKSYSSSYFLQLFTDTVISAQKVVENIEKENKFILDQIKVETKILENFETNKTSTDILACQGECKSMKFSLEVTAKCIRQLKEGLTAADMRLQAHNLNMRSGNVANSNNGGASTSTSIINDSNTTSFLNKFFPAVSSDSIGDGEGAANAIPAEESEESEALRMFKNLSTKNKFAKIANIRKKLVDAKNTASAIIGSNKTTATNLNPNPDPNQARASSSSSAASAISGQSHGSAARSWAEAVVAVERRKKNIKLNYSKMDALCGDTTNTGSSPNKPVARRNSNYISGLLSLQSPLESKKNSALVITEKIKRILDSS